MTKVILGIGNPGKEYKNTRHNVGVLFVRELHRRWELPEWHRCGTDPVMVSEGTLDGEDMVLAYSETYMNHSGAAGKALLEHFKCTPEELVVIHDDIDLPAGSWKFSCNRGAGGHNGVLSLIDVLGTKTFCRGRVGISPTSFFGNMKKPSKEKVHRFVLGKMSKGEEKKASKVLDDVEGKIREWVSDV